MTALDNRTGPPTAAGRPGPEPLSSRLGRAVPLLVGAALVLLLLEPVGPLPLQGWVPVLVGLSYVASGLLSGRRGSLLAPGVVVAVWGIAPLSAGYGHEFNGMFYLCLGTGLLIAALLAQRGFSCITPMSLALPVLFLGGTMAVAPHAGKGLTTVLAVLLAAYGLSALRSQPVEPAVPVDVDAGAVPVRDRHARAADDRA